MIEYLTIEEILEIQKHMVKRFGGLAGIRDRNLLLSAVEMPKSSMFGEDLYPSIYDKATTYLFGIVRNHPFNDANKRTGYAAAYLFLKANGISICFKKVDLEDLVVEVAKGKISKQEISHFLEHGKK